MTDFSDRLHTVFHDLAGKKAKEEGGKAYTLIDSEQDAKESPLSDNFMVFDNSWSTQFFGVMRRRYRFQAGTDNPPTYPEMHEKVKELVTEDLLNFYFKCVAAGMQVGEESSLLVRRALRLGRLNELFERDEFVSECTLQAMGWQDDYDSREMLSNYLEGSSVALASSIGLPRTEEPAHINRAWDVWAISGRSLMVLAYSAGEVMGRQNRETDLLTHAAKEMEGTDDE